MKNYEIFQINKMKSNSILPVDLINLSINKLENKSNELKQKESLPSSINYKKFILSINFDKKLTHIAKSNIFPKIFNRKIEYINKLISLGRKIKYKKTLNSQNEAISKLIIYLINYNINNKQYLVNEKLLKSIILMIYWEIFPIKNFIFIINIFLDSTINKIIQDKQVIDNPSLFNSCPLNFINDLFEALISIPRKYINNDIHIKLIDELIQILDLSLFSFPFNLELYKLPIWFKLLGNKILNLDIKSPSLYNKLISFLVKIYKYNFQNLYYYNNFYEQSAISFDYYINSLDFLCELYKEEENSRLNKKFKIKNGFYIYNNIPLTLDKIKFKTKAYSIIFSFKLTKIFNKDENTILLNLENYEQKKVILRFIINKNNGFLKIIDGKNVEWNTNIPIILNKDYLVCVSQESKFFTKFDLSLNDNKIGYNNYTTKLIGFPDFEKNMILDLGKSNFEGIFGEVLIINKNIKIEDIYHIYNLKDNYANIITTINYKSDLTNYLKYKKYPDITFFQNLKYECILKILTYQIHSILNDSKSVIIKPYGVLKYSQYTTNNNNYNYNNNLNIRLYSTNYSIEHFLTQHGFEYLIFQLHRIISLSENDELLNFYLYKTLNFVLEYIKMASEYIFPKKENKVKTEKKYTNFILSLLTILNTNKRELQLDEKIKNIFLSYSKLYREKKAAFILQKINFSILLNNKIFRKDNISYYDKLLNEMISYLNIEEKENSLQYKEIFYKFLLLDDIFESKEKIHKKYMSIISYFIIGNKKNKIKDINTMRKILIRYIIEIISQKKLYHYLKVLYLNMDSIKEYFKENEIFIKFIEAYSKPINNNNNNKYSEYIQILCFLLNEIIKNEKYLKKEYYLKNPNYMFIRCIFIHNFNINNKIKLKFIKSTLDDENEMAILKHCINKKNINFLSLIDKSNFISNLNYIIKYYYFLYNEYLSVKNKNLETIIKKGIKLILDFIDEISKINEFKALQSINGINDDNSQTKENKELNDTKKVNKDIPIHDFIKNLFRSSAIRFLFILYFNIYDEKELLDLKNFIKYVNISIDKMYNPFYFYLLSPDIILNVNSKKSNLYKADILKIIINNIILCNSNNNNNANGIITLNSIIILIRIYQIVLNDSLDIAPLIEKNIINYLKYIFENYFVYSKIILDINMIDKDIVDENLKNIIKNILISKEIIKKNIEHKLVLEIALDIFFILFEKKDNNELILFLNNILNLNEKNSIFFIIDEFYCLEVNNNINHPYKYNIINFLNNSKMLNQNFAGKNMINVLLCIYFLIYFIDKKSEILSIFNINKENEKKKNEIINIVNKILEILFKNCMDIFKANSKKIKKCKIKDNSNIILFKTYDLILEHFFSKYKDNDFNLSEGKDVYLYFSKYVQNSRLSNDMEKINLRNSNLSAKHKSNENNSSFTYSKHKKRKSTFMINQISLNEDQNNEIKNEKNDNLKVERPRSSSENYSETNSQDNYYKEEDNLKNDNKNDDNINDNNKKEEESPLKNKKEINDLKAFNKEIKSDKGTTEYSMSFTNDMSCLNNNESSSESDSENSSYEEDNNNLKYNSNYDMNKPKNNNNSMNVIMENDLQKKDINNNILSPNKLKHNMLSLENNSKDRIIFSEEKNISKINLENNNKIQENKFFYNNEHKYLNDKLKKIDAPYLYYKKLMSKTDPKWAKIVFNPKRTIFKSFGFSFKHYIFNNRRFNKLKNTFKMKYKNVELEMSIPEEENYILNYPSKLKNFTCTDFYKPFLKPMLNFFENEYFKSAHPYIKNDIYKNDISERDKFCKIKYEKLILERKEKKVSELKDKKARCENICNKGSIFGVIHFFNSLMVFKDNSNKDERLSKNISIRDKLFFLFSSDTSDRLTNLNKYIIIYYSEIKEIILRKFCFNPIAYEIFMKDGRSYFFNFFSKKNLQRFYDNLISRINILNNKLKMEKPKDQGIYKKYKYDHNYVNFSVIEEANKEFEKNEYSKKYVKNEITNFQYLLLVNKFSYRTYNDSNQYLVFPLLYMDINKKKGRDLSKAICLNRDLTEEDYTKYENNFETMGHHFNNHYSNMAYVLYYLMRVIPFTYSQIKLQSGHFDSPSRMFTNLENLLFVYSISDENRELCPECFYSYESFLNLNYNDFGFTKTNYKQINHFNTSQNIGIVEFIIDLRKILEKKELSPWINNIFGSNQSSENYESLNKFPEYSYEQYNNFINEKERLISEIGEDEMSSDLKKMINDKIKDLKNRIQLLSLGVTPSQLFKHPHPIKEKNPRKQNINMPLIDNKNKNVKLRNKKSNKNINKNINNNNTNNLIDFIQKTSFKDLLYILNNNDNEQMKIIFIFESIIKIFNFKNNSQCININLEDEIQIIKIKPYKNIFVELYDNTYLICRLVNRTLLLLNGENKTYIEWPSIITAIELYSHEELSTYANNEIHMNKVILGDEKGNLSLIEIETEYNEKKKEFKINSLNYAHKRNKTFYSYINGILYNKRLNIIISSCNDGFISINNGFSFEILNIIEIDNNPNIINFKLSEYDLLYIYTNKNIDKSDEYNLYCYTLNGIKASELKEKDEYINYFINNHGIIAICKNGKIYEYNYATLKKIESNLDNGDLSENGVKGEVLFCMECSELQDIFVIFNKDIKIIKINKEM